MFSPITYDSLSSLSSNNHGNVDEIPLMPSGFAILSNKDHPNQEEENEGSIMTVLFQVLDKSSKAQDIPKRSIRKLYNLVNNTLSSIRAALFEAPDAITYQDGVEQGCMW